MASHVLNVSLRPEIYKTKNLVSTQIQKLAQKQIKKIRSAQEHKKDKFMSETNFCK